MNLISSQSKVISVFQILIFYFAHKVIILFFIVSEMLLTSINPVQEYFLDIDCNWQEGVLASSCYQMQI